MTKATHQALQEQDASIDTIFISFVLLFFIVYALFETFSTGDRQ